MTKLELLKLEHLKTLKTDKIQIMLGVAKVYGVSLHVLNGELVGFNKEELEKELKLREV